MTSADEAYPSPVRLPRAGLLGLAAIALLPLAAGSSPEARAADAESGGATAQDPAGRPPESEALRLDPVIVTATRTPEALATIPGSVTVIEREQIQAQAKVSQGLGDLLSKLVPGFGQSSQTKTNFGQTLRGRNILVLVDGVPQNTTRNVSRDLFTIDLAAVERIEVVRGATAIYGNGATGGIVNIITRSPDKGRPHAWTEVGGNLSLSHPGDSLGGRFEQGASGSIGAFDFALTVAAEHTGSFFDAKGDRIPPEPSQGDLSETDSANLFGKLGYSFGDQRLQLTANYYKATQDTDHLSDPATAAAPPGSVKARAISGLQLEDQPETRNGLVSLDYTHRDLLGSSVHAQAFYREYDTLFFPFDGRGVASFRSIAQTELESETAGGRLAIETPLSRFGINDVSALWGLDYTWEKTAQPATLYDPAAFDRSGGRVFRRIDERTFAPPVTHDSLGLFLQLEWAVNEDWLLRGGVRQEWITASVDDFVTLGAGDAITGGKVDYTDTVFNAGVVYSATDEVELFANFSQGFSLPDIGLVLRSAPAGFDVSSSTLKPLKVDNYEIGVRGAWDPVQFSLTAFYNESDLGVTSGGFALTTIRAPERVYGVEGSVDVQLTDAWRVGGTLTWLEGENDPDQDGDYTALNSFRVPPVKLTGYVEFDLLPGWRNRLQVLYSGERDRAFDDGVGFGGRPVDDYVVVDLLSSIELGPGTLYLGVENLFNEQYFPVFSQLLRSGDNTSNVAARGTVLTASYRMTW